MIIVHQWILIRCTKCFKLTAVDLINQTGATTRSEGATTVSGDLVEMQEETDVIQI